jgi:hypothetical protein
MVTRLLDHWDLTSTERAEVLGLSSASRSSLARYRASRPLAAGRDLLDREGHLLGIHASLRMLFPQDLELPDRWMTQSNRRLARRPVEVITEQGFEGPLAVHRQLEVPRGELLDRRRVRLQHCAFNIDRMRTLRGEQSALTLR